VEEKEEFKWRFSNVQKRFEEQEIQIQEMSENVINMEQSLRIEIESLQ